MLAHLDPQQEGLSITIVRCTRPRPGQPVRSLHEFTGRGTPPWQSYLEIQPLLLGVESLAGVAVTQFRPRVDQNLREEAGFTLALRTEWEESAMACPLIFENRIAGCSLVASTRVNYFTPARQQLIQDYTNLMVLAYDPGSFYEKAQVRCVKARGRDDSLPGNRRGNLAGLSFVESNPVATEQFNLYNGIRGDTFMKRDKRKYSS
jgi:hypothetical protein